MQKKASLLIGLTLLALGFFALIANLLVRVNGLGSLLGFRAWPILVVGAGLLLCLPPFIFTRIRGLSGMFVPGFPVLVTGLLLFIASISGIWSIWARLWPLEVLSVALAFAMMAIFLRVPWLMIPASIIGFTGLVLQFCAVTGWWSSWAVLWTVEPFSVGLPLLIIGIFRKSEGVKLAGIILCGLAGLAFAGMSSFLVTSLWITRLVGPAIILTLGVVMVFAALSKPADQKPLAPAGQAPENPVEGPAA